MKTFVKEFNYPDSKTGEAKARRLLVLNEDATRFGGIDLSTVTPEEEATLVKNFAERDITDFSRKPKTEGLEEKPAPKIGMYKAFSKSKILES